MPSSPTNLGAWDNLREIDPALAAKTLNQLKRAVFVPHEMQRAVMQSDARFRVLCAGRRSGKTVLAAHECLRAALARPNQMVWVVSNSDKSVRRFYRILKKQVPRALLAKEPPSDGANNRILDFVNGSAIELYTGGSPDTLAGEGVHFVVIDEAALIPEAVWLQLIRPTLTDTRGRALLISTPRGRNYFHKLYFRGLDGRFPAYKSWHFPTSVSPYIDDDEIEDARDTLPDLVFRQEYLAEFVANAASIFLLDDIKVQQGLVPPAGWVTLGVDLAKKEDFTVIDGCNSVTRQPCVYERFNEISWSIQQQYILDTVHDLEADPAVEGVTIAVDSTGVGDVVFDNLEDAGIDVVGINFASGAGGRQKERMVRLLAADLEKGRATIHQDQLDEFEHYEYAISPNGRMMFAAPEGEHDDKVSAKMLQNWAVVHEAPPGIQVIDPTQEPEDDDEPGTWDEAVEIDVGAAEVLLPDSPAAIMSRAGAWDG